MEITQPFGQDIQALAKTKEKGEPFGQTVSALAQARNDFRKGILEASSEASLNSGNQPLSLLYKTALENINEVLEAETGQANAINVAVDSDLDVSPEATAERIVVQATGFFEQFQKLNPDLSETDAKSNFLTLIREGIQTGFAEAKNILEGLSVLEGEVAENIDATYNLVQKGLDVFESEPVVETESKV